MNTHHHVDKIDTHCCLLNMLFMIFNGVHSSSVDSNVCTLYIYIYIYILIVMFLVYNVYMIYPTIWAIVCSSVQIRISLFALYLLFVHSFPWFLIPFNIAVETYSFLLCLLYIMIIFNDYIYIHTTNNIYFTESQLLLLIKTRKSL